MTTESDDRLKRGEKEEGAAVGVLDELTNGTGLGIVLREIEVWRGAANNLAGCQPAIRTAE